jgi:hypothetical protein
MGLLGKCLDQIDDEQLIVNDVSQLIANDVSQPGAGAMHAMNLET